MSNKIPCTAVAAGLGTTFEIPGADLEVVAASCSYFRVLHDLLN